MSDHDHAPEGENVATVLASYRADTIAPTETAGAYAARGGHRCRVDTVTVDPFYPRAVTRLLARIERAAHRLVRYLLTAGRTPKL